MLVTFRSKASAEITMLADTAKFLLNIMGKDLNERGVITIEQIPSALAKLEAAVAVSKASAQAQHDHETNDHHQDQESSALVRIDQRAWPVIEMLRNSLREQADITWGV